MIVAEAKAVEKPRLLTVCSTANRAYVRATIRNVEFRCRASGRISKYNITVEWEVTDGKTIEFTSLESWIREFARSREWLIEELVAEIWQRVRSLTNGYTVVKAVGHEGNMRVRVVKEG